MIPLHHDPHFTFRFDSDRIIPRFHLEGLPAGRRIGVFKMESATGKKLDLLSRATVGEGGWVDLPQPLLVRAGEAFLAEPEAERVDGSPGKMLLSTLVVAGLLALVGYVVGLVGGNQVALAVCCGALGAFVVLLGYGPIALLVGVLGGVAGWLSRKKNSSSGD